MGMGDPKHLLLSESQTEEKANAMLEKLNDKYNLPISLSEVSSNQHLQSRDQPQQQPGKNTNSAENKVHQLKLEIGHLQKMLDMYQQNHGNQLCVPVGNLLNLSQLATKLL